MRIAAVACCCVAATSCVEPIYDDTIGREGVPTEPGSLAGMFAMESTAIDKANAPVFGKVDAGSVSYALVQRRWRSDEPNLYDEDITVCDVVNFEVAGITTVNTPDTIAGIPTSQAVLTVEHETGSFVRGTYREFWAVEGLSNDDAFPSDVDADVFYDADADGHPGTTVTASGLVSGDVYVAQRKTVDHHGVVQGTDSSLGLAYVTKEGIVLGATSDLLKTESPRTPHPDPKQSWWFDLRLDDGASCDDVLAARDDERLPRIRPF
jgi:hypothetical protein